MRMDTEEIGAGVTKANLVGRLDISGVQEIDLCFSALSGSCPALTVDLLPGEFIASMGLRTLIVGARTVARKGGKMILLQPTEAVKGVLISSGTDSVVPILHKLDEAIRAVGG